MVIMKKRKRTTVLTRVDFIPTTAREGGLVVCSINFWLNDLSKFEIVFTHGLLMIWFPVRFIVRGATRPTILGIPGSSAAKYLGTTRAVNLPSPIPYCLFA